MNYWPFNGWRERMRSGVVYNLTASHNNTSHKLIGLHTQIPSLLLIWITHLLVFSLSLSLSPRVNYFICLCASSCRLRNPVPQISSFRCRTTSRNFLWILTQFDEQAPHAAVTLAHWYTRIYSFFICICGLNLEVHIRLTSQVVMTSTDVVRYCVP
jgi:hypothetical protein